MTFAKNHLNPLRKLLKTISSSDKSGEELYFVKSGIKYSFFYEEMFLKKKKNNHLSHKNMLKILLEIQK